MSDLRERLRALDALDVPDVMSRARMIGPKPPDHEPAPAMRRIGALVFVAAVVIVAALLIARALHEPARLADRPTPTPTVPVGSAEVIQYTRGAIDPGGDLVAWNPDTGEQRTIVHADTIPGRPQIFAAAWSPDGRWVAFDVLGCGPEMPSAGLWVTDTVGEPRHLTTRTCLPELDFAGPDAALWAWSPTGAQLVSERDAPDGDHLVLIDPSSGRTTELGGTFPDSTSLTWSPDGRTITIAGPPRPAQGSVYSIDVDTGERSTLVRSLGYVYGISQSGIRWSPNGEHMAILVADKPGPYRLILVEPDGSGTRRIDGEVQDVEWSPDGSRLAYATFTGPRGDRLLRIWSLSGDDATPSLVYESASYTIYETANLAWSPDGRWIAFSTVTEDGEIVHLTIDADAPGDLREIDENLQRSWRGGWYFCGCYG